LTKHITDKELLDLTRKKREEIRKHRIKEHQDREKKKVKNLKNKRELPEDNYLILTNDFIEAAYKQSFSQNEGKVLWFLVRKTWGWQKLSDFIPLKQFEKELDILKPHISRALSSLTQRQIVTKLGNKRYAIQVDISFWQDKPRKNRGKKRELPKK